MSGKSYIGNAKVHGHHKYQPCEHRIITGLMLNVYMTSSTSV